MQKYGLTWAEGLDDAQIEIAMIQAGGFVTGNGTRYGSGLFEHYRNLQTLLWPEGEDHHRWSDLMLSEILANRITVIAGSRDSGKTHVALSRYALTDYFCFPNDTLTLMSSTHAQGLQLRVYGDLKDLFSRAKDLRPWLPGNLVESKYGVFTDQLAPGSTVRDMRKGIVCFPAGTQVDTPKGNRNIESLISGDVVTNAIGCGEVLTTFRSIAPFLIRLTLKDGRTIDATPEHPILTQRGWVELRSVTTCDRVFSACETLRALPSATGCGLPKQEILLKALPHHTHGTAVRSLPESFSTNLKYKKIKHGEILQHSLRLLMASETLPYESRESALSSMRNNDGVSSFEQDVLLNYLPKSIGEIAMPAMRKSIRFDSGVSKSSKDEILFSKMQTQSYRESLCKIPPTHHQTGIEPLEIASFGSNALSLKDRQKNQRWQKSLVRNRHCVSEIETGNRSRWRDTPGAEEGTQRPEENGNIAGTGVDRIEVLESRGDPRFDARQGGYPVYNIEVAGHPSYSVNSIVVHNCVPCVGGDGEWLSGLEKFIGVKQKRRRLLGDEVQFMDGSYLNVMSNLDKGDFKGVFCGNFLGRGDPLDRLAEPVNGWSSHAEPVKTNTWENKLGGRTLNLVGTDSPNFDFPKDQPARYPYLISWDDVDRVAQRYGTDSLQYWSQIKGVRKSDLMAHRILTIDICRKFGAFDSCLWEGTPITKVYALDAAFGGDRAVGGMVEFGSEVGGRVVVKPGEPRTIPIKISDALTPEDQLANAVREDCLLLGIPPQNVFFDAGMRATLGIAIARIFSAQVNAINFGGPATTRPVSSDDFVFDEKTRSRRLKRCDEAYSKFVTELNYSVRMVVESRQMRQIPEEVVREFEMREWTRVSGDRIEIETKAETKKRMGMSPDLADWMAIGVEGCRRLGFQIEMLKEINPAEEDSDQWLEKAIGKFRTFERKHSLTYGQ